MSDKLHISWDRYEEEIEKLAIMVHEDGYKFNQVVCIAKGGLRVGDIFARLFDVPLAIMSVESYHGDEVKDQRGQIIFGNSLAKTTPNIGSKILLVDDLADSGTTFEKCVEWLQFTEGFFIEDIKTATMWLKGSSSYTPDYFVEYLEDNPWIVQPMEKYEEINIEQLIKNREQQ
tara:strand:- start:24 stop:545 length:522 start_codon:yes stop_codon:yes gene_type:complete